MKKILALFMALLLCMLACACDGASGTLSAQTSVTTCATNGESSDQGEKKIENIKSLELLDEVVSAKRVNVTVGGTENFKLTFISEGLKICAEISVPEDYEEKNYPLLLYFPGMNTEHRLLASEFAANGISVVRLHARGSGGSEGEKDLGGTDYKDAVKLIEICQKADFWRESKIFLAGGSEGSVTAFRTAAECEETVAGAAAADVISDLTSFAEYRGEAIKQNINGLIGETNDLAGEYAKRSAITFAEKIKCPLLLFSYTENPLFPEEQASKLHSAVSAAGGKSEHRRIDTLGSDFRGGALQSLVMWIKTQNGEVFEEPKIDFVFKNGEDEREQAKILAEAGKVMEEINSYIGLKLEKGTELVCIFDNNFSDYGGRSAAFYESATMYIVNYGDFAHEYVHMLMCFCEGGFFSNNDARITEGFAMYIESIWYDRIRSTEYEYLIPAAGGSIANETEHAEILALMSSKGLEYNLLNYNKAFVAYICGKVGVENTLALKDEYFQNYYVGLVISDYLISECGGMEKFVSFYINMARPDVKYGKNMSQLAKEALEWNLR